MMPKTGRWEDLEKAYLRLGLTPLDQFMEEQYKKNLSRHRAENTVGLVHDTEPLFRQLGATTWMCVRACLDILHGSSVTVLCNSPDEVRAFMLKTLRTLGAPEPIRLPGLERARYPEATLSVRQVPDRVPQGFIYDDTEWAQRMERRAQGPFEMTREVHLSATKKVFQAYAEEEEYLYDLTKEGAQELLSENPDIQTKGFVSVDKNWIIVAR